jgi:exopolysaccharide production protein ExoY
MMLAKLRAEENKVGTAISLRPATTADVTESWSQEDRVIALPSNDAEQQEKPKQVRQTARKRWSLQVYPGFGKRFLDVALIGLSSPLWLPLYALVVVVLLILQGRPIHYRAERVGLNGTSFGIIKFRTMPLEAEGELERLLAENEELAQEYALYAKLRHDPRVTRVGAFLRRFSLDEIPQLWNVIGGTMSLVGPRPPAVGHEVEYHYGVLASRALSLRPGLTGMWQVAREWPFPYERRVWLDLIYASRCSFLVDLKILAKTIPSVFRGHGFF